MRGQRMIGQQRSERGTRRPPVPMPACPMDTTRPALQGNPLAPKMLYAAIAMGYVYQGPPFRCASQPAPRAPPSCGRAAAASAACPCCPAQPACWLQPLPCRGTPQPSHGAALSLATHMPSRLLPESPPCFRAQVELPGLGGAAVLCGVWPAGHLRLLLCAGPARAGERPPPYPLPRSAALRTSGALYCMRHGCEGTWGLAAMPPRACWWPGGTPGHRGRASRC